jgi:hypothetical protein
MSQAMKLSLNKHPAIGLVALTCFAGIGMALLYQPGWPASQLQAITEAFYTGSVHRWPLHTAFLLLTVPVAASYWLRQRRLRHLNQVIAIRNIACKVTTMLDLKAVTPCDLACLEAGIIELQQSDYARVSPVRLANHFVDVIVYGLQLARLMNKKDVLDELEHESIRILKIYCHESMHKLDDFLLSRGVDFQDNIALTR